MDVQRVALITGCGKADGIGWATAMALAAAGMRLMVSDAAPSGVPDIHGSASPGASTHGLEQLVDAIERAGGTAFWTCGDVASEKDAASLIGHTVARYGRLDILVNNAGAPHGRDRADIAEVPAEAWDRIMAVNARGVFLMSRAAVPVMRKQRWGRIINVSSAIVRHAARHRTAYTASKAAVAGFTQALAMDVAADGITANAVCPGSILTARARSTTQQLGWGDLEQGLADRAKAIPMGRHGTAREVADVIVFLASQAAAYITGQHIFIDGGGLPLPAFAGEFNTSK